MMFNLFSQLRDEFILKILHQEREEVIPLDEITELHLTTSPKDAFGLVKTEHGEIIGNVYGHGNREESRQKCIEQAQEVTQSQYTEGFFNE